MLLHITHSTFFIYFLVINVAQTITARIIHLVSFIALKLMVKFVNYLATTEQPTCLSSFVYNCQKNGALIFNHFSVLSKVSSVKCLTIKVKAVKILLQFHGLLLKQKPICCMPTPVDRRPTSQAVGLPQQAVTYKNCILDPFGLCFNCGHSETLFLFQSHYSHSNSCYQIALFQMIRTRMDNNVH